MFKLRVAPGEASQELAAGLSDDSTTLADALAKKPCSPKVAVFPFGVEAKEEEDPEVFAGDVSDSKELKVSSSHKNRRRISVLVGSACLVPGLFLRPSAGSLVPPEDPLGKCRRLSLTPSLSWWSASTR